MNFGRKRFEPADNLIPSSDGAELYVFSNGRHLRTLDGHTGAVKHLFAYETHGYLASITDAYGIATIIERDAAGKPLSIIAPDGQKTALSLDAHGYLASIADPGGNGVGSCFVAFIVYFRYTSLRCLIFTIATTSGESIS